MTNDQKSGGELAELTRPIIGIENRTAQEVFDIMADRIRFISRTPSHGKVSGVDIGEIAAAIRVNLYRHDANMPSYPGGIVEEVLRRALSTIKEPRA